MDTRFYLIGKRYIEEKKEEGRPLKDEELGHYVQVLGLCVGRSSKKIADQVNVNEKTVRRAETYVKAVDSVSENTGISPQKIVSGVSRKDLQELSEKSVEVQKDTINKEAPA